MWICVCMSKSNIMLKNFNVLLVIVVRVLWVFLLVMMYCRLDKFCNSFGVYIKVMKVGVMFYMGFVIL